MEESCRLPFAQVEQIAALDHVPHRGWQIAHCRQEPPSPFVFEKSGLGRWDRISRDTLGYAQSQTEPTSGAPPAVQRLIADDAEEPGAKISMISDPPKRAMCLENRLLEDILGIVGVANNQISDAHPENLVSSNEGNEGIGVSRLGAADQFVIIQWTVLHSPVLHRRPIAGSGTCLAPTVYIGT